MELVSSQKLEAVANYIGEMEMYGDCVCYNFNESLKESRIDVPCDVGSCEGDCPFYSKENFVDWIKPDKKLSIREVKRPKQRDFIGYSNKDNSLLDKDSYIKALEKYCNDLENILADDEYDLDSAECDNKALIEKLSKIRDVLDEGY